MAYELPYTYTGLDISNPNKVTVTNFYTCDQNESYKEGFLIRGAGSGMVNVQGSYEDFVEETTGIFIFEESPFENQNRLLSAMTGIEISCFEKTAMKMDTESGIYAKGDDFTCLLHGENEEGDAPIRKWQQ